MQYYTLLILPKENIFPVDVRIHTFSIISTFSTFYLQVSLGLQSYIAELLKGILYTERNQQIMCDAGMPHQLLTLGYVALADDTHPLHPPFRAMFERLAAQALTPRDLR